MISPEKIQEATQRLVKAYDPVAIYLYGSYAWGNPDDESDLNMVVVVDASDQKIYKRSDLAFDTLLSLKIPKNIVVFTKQEFDTLSADKTSLTYEVKHKGKILYARG